MLQTGSLSISVSAIKWLGQHAQVLGQVQTALPMFCDIVSPRLSHRDVIPGLYECSHGAQDSFQETWR